MGRAFPVVHSMLSPEALARQVLPAYGIGDVEDVRLFQAGFNDTYRVRTKRDEAYFLRVYRRGWRTREDARCELDALDHLRRRGIPVAFPLERQDGGFLTSVEAPEGDRFAALFVEAPGTPLSYEADPVPTARKYGSAVAAMHNALEGFTSAFDRFQIDLEHLIDAPLSRVAPLLANRPDAWAYLKRFGHVVRQAIVDLPAEELEQGFCHGDLQGYHAHVDDNGVLTFYDFDGGGFGLRAYDLAVFRWCARLEAQEELRWTAFLAAYRAVRRVSDLELEAVPLLVCARHIWHMGVHAQNAPHWGFGALDDGYFDRRIGWLRALASDYGIVV